MAGVVFSVESFLKTVTDFEIIGGMYAAYGGLKMVEANQGEGSKGEASISTRALCVSLESLSERAEHGDPRAQELLVESVIHLERYLRAV